MFDRLLQRLSGDSPIEEASAQFSQMLVLVRSMIQRASRIYWGEHVTLDELKQFYSRDDEVNRLQRSVRKQVIEHLNAATPSNVSYGLLLMSLVKDAERLGDYAKNLAETHQLTGRGAGDLVDVPVTAPLREIAEFVEHLAEEACDAYAHSDRARAEQLAKEGKLVSRRCDQLLCEIAQSSVTAADAVDLTLAARYYKRLVGHLLNLLSSLLVPLDELDYLGKVHAEHGRDARFVWRPRRRPAR